MNEPKEIVKEKLAGKRIGSIDYGQKRLGLAVCDELHISIRPLSVLNPSKDDFWTELVSYIEKERISSLVVGMPYRLDNQRTDLMREIEEFVIELKSRTGLDVYECDESFSTSMAGEMMFRIGKKKKSRAKKGNKDLIAAAIILRDFLNEMEG